MLVRDLSPEQIANYCGLANSWLDGRHVVFGEVLEGMDIVRKIEAAKKVGNSDSPKEPIVISESGELEVPPEGIHVEL
jgi:peptidyl-prolyl cis-trans isomerase B (cyclophilin B)